MYNACMIHLPWEFHITHVLTIGILAIKSLLAK